MMRKSTRQDHILEAEIVKCKLGDIWMLAVAREDGGYSRYKNTRDFPLRRTKLEVKADLRRYLQRKSIKLDAQGTERN